jgi:hypothetical protein
MLSVPASQHRKAAEAAALIVPPMLQRKCACGGSSGLTGRCSACEKKKLIGEPLQTKLRINDPGDEYEREADQVAARVMQMPANEFGVGPKQSSGLVQRRLSNYVNPVQRQEATHEAEHAKDAPSSDTPAEKADTPSEKKEDESSCPSWRADPESITKRAAEFYARNHLTPPSQATVERVDCEPPISNGNYGCYAHFSDGLVVRVIVRATDIVVGKSTGPFTTMRPPPDSPLCFYEYSCPEGQLVLTVKQCLSAQPSPPPGPTLVGQRRAAPGAAGAMDAGPLVQGVLGSAGKPLDAATRDFFSTRFGHDFANVRIHADATAAQAARSVNALAFTVGDDVVFDAGQYAPSTRAGQELLAHELTHVVQQGGAAQLAHRGYSSVAAQSDSAVPARAAGAVIQRQPRQPQSEGPALRDVPILLEKLEFDVGQNLLDYGHHIYQAATLFPDNPEVLKAAFGRYALGANVLKDTYRFFGVKPDTAGKLAVGTGILFKSLTFIREGKLTLDFQFDIGRGVKLETNFTLEANPNDASDVRKADVGVGFVGRF